VFSKSSGTGYKQALPGIKIKTLVHGDKTLMTEFPMEKGSVLPKHSHPHEQTGYLVKGKMTLTIGAETFTVEPGDSWCIPGNTEHGAAMLEDTIAVEVFSPVRKEYVPEQ